jgi:phenylalanyl-tRNA synthetase beta chain
LVLKRRKIRGVESNGMVLSERELGLGEDHEGILVLEDDPATGTPVTAILPGGAVLDVENKAITKRPDMWGHYGAARDLAATLDRQLKPLDLGDAPPEAPPQVKVTVETPELCPRYLGWVIGGVRIEPSPVWLRRRLEQTGQRPINNVVDLTNYILLECGQPLHAFDRRQIAQGHIVVRAARKGEKVVTLDEVERELPEGACVIADPERPVAVAGIMGLANSEVMADTTEIILEVANFELVSIRNSSKALGLRSESSIRFEKGLDMRGVPVAARRFLALLRQICPTARPLGAPCDVSVEPPPPVTIRVPDGWFAQRLGTPIADERIDHILRSLGFELSRASGEMVVTVPSWRAGGDITLPEDLLEEVGRIHGWDKIRPVPIVGELEVVPKEPEREARKLVRHALTDLSGLTEIYTYPVTTAEECRRTGIEPGTIAITNAEQPGLDLLAPSLLPNLLRSVSENLKYRSDVGVYVVAPVFLEESEGLPRQDEHVAFALARREGEGVFQIKGAVENLLEVFSIRGAKLEQTEGPAWLHPGRCARLGRGREAFGWFGQLHPRVARAFEIEEATAVADLNLVALRGAQGKDARMRPVGRYPTVLYDVAVVVDGRTPAAEVEGALRRAVPEDLLREVRLFDVYEGRNIPDGKRSLAFSIVFGSLDRTLDTADVDGLRAKIVKTVEGKGWSLRV